MGVSLGDAANWAQVASVVVPASGFAWVYRKRMCKIWWCWRWGRHDVSGTTWKTCDAHLTKESQERVFERHAKKRPKQHEYLNEGPP